MKEINEKPTLQIESKQTRVELKYHKDVSDMAPLLQEIETPEVGSLNQGLALLMQVLVSENNNCARYERQTTSTKHSYIFEPTGTPLYGTPRSYNNADTLLGIMFRKQSLGRNSSRNRTLQEHPYTQTEEK